MRMLCKNKISDCQTPLSFRSSSIISSNSVNAISIATFILKEPPNNSINFLEDSVIDRINIHVINGDGKQRGVNQGNFSSRGKFGVIPPRTLPSDFINHRIEHILSQPFRRNQHTKVGKRERSQIEIKD